MRAAGAAHGDPATTVLLLEAGPDYRGDAGPPAMHDAKPLGMNDPLRFPDHCWPDLTARRADRQPPRRYDRGRGADGSSSIDYQVAFLGVRDDYDRWAADGAAGRSFADVLPYLPKLEDDHDFGDAPYHGRGGPVPIERKPVSAWGQVWMARSGFLNNAGSGMTAHRNGRKQGRKICPRHPTWRILANRRTGRFARRSGDGDGQR